MRAEKPRFSRKTTGRMVCNATRFKRKILLRRSKARYRTAKPSFLQIMLRVVRAAARRKEGGAKKKASGMSLENNMPLTAEGVRRRGFFHKGFSDPDPGRDRKICGEGKCPGR